MLQCIFCSFYYSVFRSCVHIEYLKNQNNRLKYCVNQFKWDCFYFSVSVVDALASSEDDDEDEESSSEEQLGSQKQLRKCVYIFTLLSLLHHTVITPLPRVTRFWLVVLVSDLRAFWFNYGPTMCLWGSHLGEWFHPESEVFYSLSDSLYMKRLWWLTIVNLRCLPIYPMSN